MFDPVNFFIGINIDEKQGYHTLCLKKAEILRMLEKVYRLSKSNDLVYYFISNILIRLSEHYNDITKKFMLIYGDELLEELYKVNRAKYTLKQIKGILDSDEINYVFIKTYRNVTYAPNDIDILVSIDQVQKAIKTLRKNGFKVVNYNNVEVRAYKKNFIRVDVYTTFIYMGHRFKIENLIFYNTRKVRFLGETILIPTEEYDFITLVIHAVMGHRMINLLDFIYIDEILSNKINTDKLVRASSNDEILARCLLAYLKYHTYLRKILLQGKYKSNLFPFLFKTKDILQILGDDVNLCRKINYIISHIIDKTYNAYKKSNISISRKLKENVQKLLFMHRLLLGDRHIANY